MRQEIHFKGLSLTPDNHHAEPGALSLCAGAELHDGALRPSVLPSTTIATRLPVPRAASGFYDDYTATLRFVHQGNGYTHFIGTFINDSLGIDEIYWYDDSGSYKSKLLDILASDVLDIQAVGNTLCFICSSGVHYFLWKDDRYLSLGQCPPFLQLQFSLTLDGTDDKNVDDHFVRCSEQILQQSGDEYNVKETLQAEVTEQVMARINHRISKINAAGCFYAPFLIRYCYRLYDNKSTLWHSSPVLLFPMLQHPVTTIFKPTTGNEVEYYIFMQRAKLYWRCLNVGFGVLENWKDIIKSVDFYVTPQFSRIDTAGLVKKAVKVSEYYGNEGFLDGMYYTSSQDRLQQTYFDSPQVIDGSLSDAYAFELPEVDEASYFSRISSESSFFRLASVGIDRDNFSSAFRELDFSPDVLQNISVQDKMIDDYRSNNSLYAQGGYVYNRRLHIYDLQENLHLPHPFALLFPYFNPDQAVTSVSITAARVTFKTEGGDRVVQMAGEESTNKVPLYYLQRAFVFIADSRAVSVHLSVQASDSDTRTYMIKLNKSPLLEGAVNFRQNATQVAVQLPAVSNDVIAMPNKMFASEVSIPFMFPLEGRQTIGVGSIIGLATTTLALSQGQFGQFPLIVFCSDGVWVLDVTKTGTYSPPHPVSREVCVNARSICQLDQSVLFATSRGLSRIVGSTVTSVSDALDGPLFDAAAKLPGLSTMQFDEQSIDELVAFNVHPFDMFKEGMLIYDFISSRVLVVKSDSDVAYVLSLRDGTWSTMYVVSPLAVANAYPYPYYQGSTGVLWHIDKSYDYTSQHLEYALVITRGMSFAATMQVIQGFQQIHDCSEVPEIYLYGSNDDISWKYIGMAQRTHAPYLPGHPFRFFRVMLYLKMKTYEKYSSLMLDVIEKYQKL